LSDFGFSLAFLALGSQRKQNTPAAILRPAGGTVAAAGLVSRRARSRARSCPLALSDDDAGIIGSG